MTTTSYDAQTGRPMNGDVEALETLSDQELEGELTIASLYPETPREQRWQRLRRELIDRRRAYAGRRPATK